MLFLKNNRKTFFYTPLATIFICCNHLYLLQFTEIPVLPIGSKYWQLFCSGHNGWLKIIENLLQMGWRLFTKKKTGLQFIKLESRNKQILTCCSHVTQGCCLGATFKICDLSHPKNTSQRWIDRSDLFHAFVLYLKPSPW